MSNNIKNNRNRHERSSEYDVIVIGSGVAGMFAAIKAARFARVCLLTKDALYNSNTWLAQGGIAAALGGDDSPGLHMADTLSAGAGLCDAEAVKVMVEDGPQRINDLVEMSMPFNLVEGKLAMTREGAHSKKRIVYAGGDATGRLLHETLAQRLLSSDAIDILEHTFVTELLVSAHGEVLGVRTLEGKNILSGSVILAAGGLGQVYSRTTNPSVATGDGVAMAYRVGAEVADMEFIQFHPTVFQSPEGDIMLISEAVRGEGALLRNARGERFMPEYHEMAELGPRDIVSRAIVHQMKKGGSSSVYLDITFKDSDYLKKRFPTIYAKMREHGLDMSIDLLPVSPGAHYAIGGVRTGLFGETNLPGLYVCGEAACTGVHGANRLASNSLLEGLVFAERVAGRIEKSAKALPGKAYQKAYQKAYRRLKPELYSKLREELRKLMFSNVGILRDEEGLLEIRRFIAEQWETLDLLPEDRATCELKNLFLVSDLIAKSALLRTESRGCHFRVDYPKPDEDWQMRHVSLGI